MAVREDHRNSSGTGRKQENSHSWWRRIQRAIFWLISRSAIGVYSRLPVFGSFRASVAIIRRGECVLIIERSDGRGISFPGGFDWPWESPEASVRREISEETGLQVKCATRLFQYHSHAEIPVRLSVFEVEAEGRLSDSWEGSPRWLPLTEIRERLLPSQKPIVDRLLQA
jgi:8-oxo-dGTP pyrophosphatase MutT (NUDIX family)